MLLEIRVCDLGVVEDLSLVFGTGMTAVTGETGAGKTLLVEAIRLLSGGKTEAHMVRAGADEAQVEGRFLVDGEEVVVSRAIPRTGRARAYVDGRMVSVAALGELGARLVDLHGQHAHQSLLSPAAQRQALDAFGGIDLEPLRIAKRNLSTVEKTIESLGGDSRTLEREMDLLRYQLEEISAAELDDPEEDEKLKDAAETLADAGILRQTADEIHEALLGDGGAVELLATAGKSASSKPALKGLADRLAPLVAELSDVGMESAGLVAEFRDDPQRLAEVQDRRHLLKQLQRKYGSTLTEVIAYREECRSRLAEFENRDATLQEYERERELARAEVMRQQDRVLAERNKFTPDLAKRVVERLRRLALPSARFEVEVSGDAGEAVTFMLGPNPGMPLLPLARAASGGELARSMLAVRLALLEGSTGEVEGPSTLVFDEVDAGIGGEAAAKVGEALAALSRRSVEGSQIFVVTHLPQVAAFADHHLSVRKHQHKTSTTTKIQTLQGEAREVELARMLSGQPESESGRKHASELLAGAASVREGDLGKGGPSGKKRSRPKKSTSSGAARK